VQSPIQSYKQARSLLPQISAKEVNALAAQLFNFVTEFTDPSTASSTTRTPAREPFPSSIFIACPATLEISNQQVVEVIARALEGVKPLEFTAIPEELIAPEALERRVGSASFVELQPSDFSAPVPLRPPHREPSAIEPPPPPSPPPSPPRESSPALSSSSDASLSRTPTARELPSAPPKPHSHEHSRHPARLQKPKHQALAASTDSPMRSDSKIVSNKPLPPASPTRVIDAKTGSVAMRLSNGMRLAFKHTDFETKQCSILLVGKGGFYLELTPETLGASTVGLHTLIDSCWGDYPSHVTHKYCQLYGISVDSQVANDSFEISFDCSVSDDGTMTTHTPRTPHQRLTYSCALSLARSQVSVVFSN